MKVSWKWLSELVDLSGAGGPEGLAKLLTFRGLEVEEILKQDQGFEKVVSVQILKKDPHPQADRLSLCQVTLGRGEPLEIVCGASNMKAGDKVALAQVGADLPNGMKIALSKIRGVTSNGMLCSEGELGLLKPGEESPGILILPEGTELGLPLARVLGREDTILVLKLTANRGDCLSHFGIAREVASALGIKPKLPQFKDLAIDNKCPIAVKLDAGLSAPQFFGVYVEGVKIGPSPAWLVKRLESLGSRSINNAVDATNLVMLELGHPVHAYDADRIAGKVIQVRTAKKGETLPLLDGTEIQLEGSELVIADAERAVGLAGVMGGGNSEVQASTTRLFLECAEFDPVLVRQASTRHQKKTEASHRFERGIDPAGLPRVISRLTSLIQELAGGQARGSVAVQLPGGKDRAAKPVRVGASYFRDFLGVSVAPEKAEKILRDLDCAVTRDAEGWLVTPPSYRRDLKIREEIAEEIARSLGYDEIPSTIPPLSSEPGFKGSTRGLLVMADRAKDLLVDLGLCEAINLAFTSRAWLGRFGLEPGGVLLNPLSEEHEALVPSLIPGLVKNALDNWNKSFGSEAPAIRLFELRPTYSASGPIAAQGEGETGVLERQKLAIAVSGARGGGGLKNELGDFDFYDLKAILESFFKGLGTRGVRILPFSGKGGGGLFHPGQSAEVFVGKEAAGYFGLLHPAQALELKARAPLWIAELDWDAIRRLSPKATESRSYKAWGEFPPMERDFALLVKDDVAADRVTGIALKAGGPLAKVAKIFDIYRGSQVAKGMTSIAVRVIFYDESRSLQEEEAEAASKKILDAWKKELGAELRG